MHIALVLHAHLPYVRHPEHGRSIEEAWLFDAMWGAYLPLLRVLGDAPRHPDRGDAPLVTLSLSPTLLEMLADRGLRRRFVEHVEGLARLASRVDPAWAPRFREALEAYERFDRDLTRAFVKLGDERRVELITTSATHAFLPALKTSAALRAQLRLGLRAFEAHTRAAPAGLWLPECGFDPRFDADLACAGARYTVLDAHGLAFGAPRPPFGVYRPVLSPSGVAYFGRELEASAAVWSRTRGYPGDPVYREFHRDVGHEAEPALLEEWTLPGGARRSTGLKIHAISGDRYDAARAADRARAHAADFVASCGDRLGRAARASVDKPVIVAPFDAELFGHWWYEGPTFLAEVLRLLARPTSSVRASSLGAILDEADPLAISTPAPSTWGEGGFAQTWLGPTSKPASMLRHVHRAEARLLEADAIVRDTLASLKRRRSRIQAIRELALLEASDWAFMLHVGRNAEYGERRVRLHAGRVERLAHLTTTEEWSPEDEAWLREVEQSSPLFSVLDEDAFANVFDPW
ncbi:MAG: 1,4-alpha-glucan branching protein domain-containing protein [Polyangiaceae bacterium]